MPVSYVSNLGRVQESLKNEFDQLTGVDAFEFMTLALQGISANTAPYVPVDTAALINSEYRTTSRDGTVLKGEIGFSIQYAPYVHDGPQKNWQKAGASNLFLERGAADWERDDLPNLVARYGE